MRIFWHLFLKSASGKNTTAAMHRGSERDDHTPFGELDLNYFRSESILLSFKEYSTEGILIKV